MSSRNIAVVEAEHLTDAQQIRLQELLLEAGTDPFLDNGNGELRFARRRMAVLKGSHVVGFFSPTIYLYRGQRSHRAGSLYLTPSARGQQIMGTALGLFFMTHKPGVAWVDDTNKASIHLFKSLGFTQQEAYPAADGGVGHWYIQAPRNVLAASLEALPGFLAW